MALDRTRVGNDRITQLGTQRGTGVTAATGLEDITGITIPATANAAKIQAETQNLRMTDGPSDTPVAGGLGILLTAGNPAEWYVGDLTNLKFIQEASGAVLNISFYNVS